MRGRLLLSVLASTVAAVPQAWIQAAPARQASTELDMLTVEAQRRPQAVIDVPVSLRVLTRAEIGQRIVLRPDDAFAATPHAILTSQRGGNDASNLVIRGIGPTAFATDPTVAVYVDDVARRGGAKLRRLGFGPGSIPLNAERRRGTPSPSSHPDAVLHIRSTVPKTVI